MAALHDFMPPELPNPKKKLGELKKAESSETSR
jgi:hypothetical protein